MSDPTAPAEPPPGEYDPHYPRLHLRPARYWVNDPNGLVHHDGRWHVFAQANPDATVHTDVCWWHADSEDLLHWRDLGIAIRPSHDPDRADRDGVWSGNAVSDGGVLRAFYSAFRTDAGWQPAMGADAADGVTFVPGDRVLATAPAEVELPDGTRTRVHTLRDPYVWRDSDPRGQPAWSLVLGAGLDAADGRRWAAALRFTSSDLDYWTWAGVFAYVAAIDTVVDDAEVDPGEMWECPAYAELVDTATGGVLSVLTVCSWARGTGIGRSLLVTGDRRGDRVRVAGMELSDHGDALYAPSLLPAPDGRTLFWGWVRETRPLADSVEAGWSGCLTFPRELRAAGGRVTVWPAAELTGLRAREQTLEPGAGTTTGTAVEVLLAEVADGARVRLTARKAMLEVEVAGDAATLAVRTPDATSDAGARDPSRLRLPGSGERWLRLLVDGSVVELFTSAGEVATTRVYPGPGHAGWSVEVHAGRCRVWDLEL